MSQHAFSPDENVHCSPKGWYQLASEKPGFIHDEAQAAAIEQLDRLWHELMDFKTKRNRFLGRSLRSPDVPRGLYFWGGVGRGKSFLMDAFYACVPYRRKRRIHFHNFMAETHRELRKFAGRKDPLLAYADEIAKSTRLLCFDEFHVSDIADAMILGRLLSALIERGVVVVTTSNYAPDDLYPGGLQRQNFLPTIELIKREMDVLNVDGGHDYRLRELTREPLFMVPADEGSERKMEQLFHKVGTGAELPQKSITVLEREIAVKRMSPGVIWFDFTALCDGPRAQTDYLEIASEYHTVFVSGIPRLSAKQASVARRFTWLVDVFYDNRVKLIASADAPPEEIYTEGLQSGEFFRTASRLTEMQSKSYLELPHQSMAQSHDQPPPGVAL
ncbi:cell division protein ZapE [Chromobacterium vaccinii]|uniref:cell division protein ZapE n=1 Tax=Chromobacterium vaccinii TaxID=1108595 RepID=UPI0031D0707E